MLPTLTQFSVHAVSHTNHSQHSSTSSSSDYESINICCFNVRGITSNPDYLKFLLENFNIKFIAISEHWLHDYNLNQINQISDDFSFLARSPAEQEHPVHCVPRLIRGHGGVALGWLKSYDKFISPLPFVSSCRMIGIEYNLSHRSLYIISVYLPSRSGCIYRRL